jgi:hypothetical protein
VPANNRLKHSTKFRGAAPLPYRVNTVRTTANIVKAGYPRASHEKQKSVNMVGKHYPDMKKVKAKVKEIGKEIRKLKYMSDEEKAVQVERVNSKITGLAEYYKTSICSNAFSYIDDRINKTAYATFSSIYQKGYDNYKMTLNSLSNRPPLYDITALEHCKDNAPDNFEYYMNREYAYNRDKGKCKICGIVLKVENRHCHRIENLPINIINRVPNLVWICNNCDRNIHGNNIPEALDKKKAGKIRKYRNRLNVEL